MTHYEELKEKIFLTPLEVASYLNISVLTVGKLLRNGQIRGVKLTNRTWRIRTADVERFVERREKEMEQNQEESNDREEES